MKTRVFRAAWLAVVLPVGALAPAFVGCAADVGDGPDQNQPAAALTAPKPYEAGCGNPATACNTTCASTSAGTTCDKDCDTVCGFNNIGVKHCTCTDATFTSCFCTAPSSGCADPASSYTKCWRGAITAPSCAAFGAPTGRTSELLMKPCPALYAECIGTDSNTGTDKGCACMPPQNSTSAPVWTCGSTNHWFSLQ